MHHASTLARHVRPAGQPPSAAAPQHDWQQGVALARSGQWAAASGVFEQALQQAPADAGLWLNLANAQRHLGRLVAAEASVRRALALAPDDTVALQLLAECLAQAHRHREALQVYQRLQATGQADAATLLGHARTLHRLHRPDQALPLLLQALAQQPARVAGHALLADALRDLGCRREAVECMKTVLALDPGNLEAMSHLSFEKRQLCDWSDWAADLQRIEQRLSAPDAPPAVAAPLGLLSLPLDPLLQTRAAQGDSRWAAAQVQPLPPVQPPAADAAPPRVRVGWLSADFREHPVAQLTVELLEQLDRSRFELHLYSIGPDDGSPLRARLQAAGDAFVDLREASDAQAAQRIRDDGVDILVDLGGHTRGQRLGILAARPAPVQATWLGYPGSSGADFIDYLIGDPLVTPVDLAPLYTEHLAQMPGCMLPSGRWRPLPQPMRRADAGLPDDAFVLCAFNHTYKINPEVFSAWCAMLHAVPQAVLWLKETNVQLHDNVRREAAARGIDPARILWAPRVDFAQHFSRLALADVFVDTWPYNAHTTAADALWAGLPVLTVYGNSFASRVAASVLHAAGLGELAFAEPAACVHAVATLAAHPELLAAYRSLLVQQRLQTPLFDTALQAAGMAELLARMAARWRSGLPPAPLWASSAAPGAATP